MLVSFINSEVMVFCLPHGGNGMKEFCVFISFPQPSNSRVLGPITLSSFQTFSQ